MAAMRPVSRQFVRALVEEMIAEGFVRLAPNPRHKTAALVTLTAKGRKQASNDAKREAALLEALARDLDAASLRSAVTTMTTLLERIDGGAGAGE
jgi:DNA-binding MarR family transcriptional regulator